MKSAPFAYQAPTSAKEAVALLAEHGDQARLLAGGQALMPLLASRAVRTRQIIDLNRAADLSFVRRDGAGLRIGALTRLRQVERDPAVRAGLPLLAEATALGGPVQVRNRATVGGALAYADPAAEYPAVAIALDARVELHGDGVRQVPAAEFFVGPHTTTRTTTELLAAVEFPVPAAPVAGAIEKVAPQTTGLARAGAVVVLGAGTSRVVLFGVTPVPVRPAEAEALLAAGAAPNAIADAAVAGLDPPDAHGLRGVTRLALARGAVVRAVAAARNRVSHV